ncbi:MAG: Smr/MutS family protein [Dissulfuribacterales bacterium]
MTEEKNFSYRPFDGLEKRLKVKRNVSGLTTRGVSIQRGRSDLSSAPPSFSGNEASRADSMDVVSNEEALFRDAMREVTPLNGENRPVHAEAAAPDLNLNKMQNEQTIVMRQLKAIVSGSADVPVSATPEFVEGIGWGADRLLVQRLHKGEFSVQAYCDLHGMDLLSAMERCEEFLKDAIDTFKGCVAIIHGRGLSSKGRPVIKETVIHWLHSGPYRRYIIAFSSAPSWDGGPGVTYVLLRQRPARRTKTRS